MPSCPKRTTACIGVIDPHPVTRHGIKQFLDNGKWDLRWETDSSPGAREFMESDGIDILLYEPVFEMPQAPSFVKGLRERHPDLVIILYTMVTEKSWLREAMDLGARALLSKRRNPDELASALELSLQGQACVSSDFLNIMCGDDTDCGISPDRLTPRELEIFKMVGLGQKASEIARTLGISPRTVDAHKQHIKDKLGVGGNAGLASAACSWLQSQWSGRGVGGR